MIELHSLILGKSSPMIEIVKLPPSESKSIKHRGRGTRLKIVLFFALCFLLFSVLFDVHLLVALFCVALVSALFLVTPVRDRAMDDADFNAGIKIRRRGKIVSSHYFMGNIGVSGGRLTQSLTITMEPEHLDGDYPQHDTFMLISGLGALYYRPDYSLFSRYKSLENKEVQIEYLPYSGAVLAFNERPDIPSDLLERHHPAAWPNVSFSMGFFSVENDAEQRDKRLFHSHITEVWFRRESTTSGFFFLRMEAKPGKQSLDIASYADGFEELEQWLFRQRYFRKKIYERAKDKTDVPVDVLVWKNSDVL